MKKTKNPTRRDRLLSKKSIFRINPVFTIQKEKTDVPCKFKHFSSRTGQRKFFLWKFFSGKGNARTVFLRSIEKINFGKPIPSGIDGKRCNIIRFVHSASFPPVLYHDFFNTPPLPADFFPKLCRSRLFFSVSAETSLRPASRDCAASIFFQLQNPYISFARNAKKQTTTDKYAGFSAVASDHSTISTTSFAAYASA